MESCAKGTRFPIETKPGKPGSDEEGSRHCPLGARGGSANAEDVTRPLEHLVRSSPPLFQGSSSACESL